MMIAKSTPLKDLIIIEPEVFNDSRGYFFESYNKEKFRKAGLQSEFIQDNQSLSQKGVLRGLHLQNPPWEQGKLVRVIKGAVLDVVLDARKNSESFGKHFSIVLSEQNKTQLWIPPGFAHGFLTLEDETIFYYKCTQLYNRESEAGIRWNDPELGIDWGVENPSLSAKDALLPAWKDFLSLF
jgi:dTDP-4-dehydrorhamnose 3,5-epimerase